MKRLAKWVCLLAAVSVLAGCGDQAKEWFETARFEEQQFNEDHAAQLYRRIVEQYPESPYARKARERLAELEGD